MPTRIILARHGETDWNLERRWQGHSDRPLNETGRAQAEELAGPPDGETRDEMLRRVLASLEAIAAAHDGETVLVVCHGGPIRAALLHHASPRSEERAGNCSVFDLEV